MTFFPDRLFDGAGAYAAAYFEQYSHAAATLDQAALRRAGELVGEGRGDRLLLHEVLSRAGSRP